MPPASPEIQRWFDEEVHPHEDALRAFLRSRFGTDEEVDDIIQESYVRLLRARETGPLACPRAYLFITARNMMLRHLRRQRRTELAPWPEEGEAAIPSDALHARSHMEKSETLDLLIAAIKALPDKCRQVMTLRKIYGLSQREVAARLGITENVVEAQSMIGMRRCADFLRKNGLNGTPLPNRQ